VRFRRLRNGPLALSRLRPEPGWPRLGLAPDPTVDEPPVLHRPTPGANAWPDDAVLLTYGELRQLIALHLTLCASTMAHDRPWVWIKERARAVSEGEAPLLISEVLSPPGLPPG
jgi:hypothetical protein